MKAVITGSNGFIGSVLRSTLLRQKAEVRCLVRSTPQASSEEVRYFVIDYSNPQSIIESGALDDADVLFHLAGVTKQLSLDGFRAGNVMPTRHLIDALTTLSAPLKRFVFISSQAAAGPANAADRPVTENDAPQPIEDYGRSKLEAENLLRKGSLPFEYTVIRPSSVYGPYDVDFLPLFKQIKSGLGIYPGNRDSYISLIHVSDLVDGILLAASSPQAANQTYFLTNEVAITWKEVYQSVSDVLNKRVLELNIPFSLIANAGRIGDLVSKITGKVQLLNSKKIELSRPKYWVCSSEKATDELGFQAQIPAQKGMKSTFEWYREAGWM